MVMFIYLKDLLIAVKSINTSRGLLIFFYKDLEAFEKVKFVSNKVFLNACNN